MQQEMFNRRIDDVRERIMAVPLPKLVQDYPGLENDIINGIVRIVMDRLEEEQAEIQGAFFLIESQAFQLHVEFRQITRELVISFIPVYSSRSKTIKEITIDHEGFGNIRTTTLTFPPRLSRLLNHCQPLIQFWVESLYGALEAAVIGGIESFRLLPIRGIHEIFQRQADQTFTSEIGQRAWFSVTNLQSLVFNYQFSHSQLINLISLFKKSQLPQYAPFQSVLALVTHEIDDAVLGGPCEFNNGVFTVPFTSLSSIPGDLCFWNAEREMFQSRTLSAIDVAQADKYDLQLNFPTQYAEQIRELVDELQPILEVQFRMNVREFRRSGNVLRRFTAPVAREGAYQALAQFLSEIISETAAKFLKKIGQP